MKSDHGDHRCLRKKSGDWEMAARVTKEKAGGYTRRLDAFGGLGVGRIPLRIICSPSGGTTAATNISYGF